MKSQELCELKDYLSYSSVNPQRRYFVKTDNAFTRKARLLQAMHRKESGSPCGSITKKGTTYFHPNLATDGSDTGCNFLSQEIFEYAKWRIEQKKHTKPSMRTGYSIISCQANPWHSTCLFP